MGKKNILLLIIYIFASLPLFSLDVAEEEVIIEDTENIVFENYTGPYIVVKTLNEIFGIGMDLGRQEGTERAVEDGQYRVVRAVDPETEEGFDADIFVLGPEGYVDHIINMRRMLAGYLEEAYRYSREDALLLAKFLTYYNAVHRRDTEMVLERYKPVVMENLREEKIGLARSYRDWPGKTMMLIPLTRRAEEGGPGSLDSDELSDEEVIEDLREEEDRGVEDRKKLVELKEREIGEEEEEIEEERRRIEEEGGGAIAPDENGGTGVEEAAEGPSAGGEPAAGDTAGEEGASLGERREELEEREEALEERRRDLEEEREEIAEDQQLVIEEEERRKEEGTGPAGIAEEDTRGDTGDFFLLTDKNGYSRLSRVDFTTGNYISRSAVDTVLGRKYYPLRGRLLVVFEERGSGGRNALGLLDAETLELSAVSGENVYDNTYILLDGSSIYAIVQRDNGWKLGRFDGELSLQAESVRNVAPYSVFAAKGSYIYIQDENDVLTAFDKISLE